MPYRRSALLVFTATIMGLLIVPVLVGCAINTAPDVEPQIQATVTQYNRLLAEGFCTRDMRVLEPVATPEQADKEFAQMSALGEGGIRLDPTLVAITFDSIDVVDNSAVVETTEAWDYVQPLPGR